MVGSHKGAAPPDQSFQIVACMTLVALLRKVEVQVGERTVVEVDREDVQVGAGVQVNPAAGHKKMTAWTAEEEGVLAGKAGNETPDGRQAVVEE